uniref:FAM86 N-terminal domain-containing protein n=1 Tax=Kwoniella pini CBS 10737 TaxID=1296096 RepID=A0A1B9I2G4_9TREE|nr:uncharacterized protein I206_04219 [Kwoniella pini CBS 10737]OCF49695.1 hypothetical protein I206_04219 [Kwoniella pini CBS 10737]
MDPLDKLRRQYFSLYPIYLINLPEPEILVNVNNQNYLIDKLLGNKIQPEDEYRKKFWRKVLDFMEIGLKKLKNDDLEINETFYDVLIELMVSDSNNQAGPSIAPKTSFRTFIYDIPPNYLLSSISISNEQLNREIILLEEQIAIQGGTTGLRTWTAAIHLAHHILHNPGFIFPQYNSNSKTKGKGIIELGAGTGFLSILLAQLNFDVVSTDLGKDQEEDQFGFDKTYQEGESQTPLARLKYNVSLSDISVKSLDWTDASIPLEVRPNIWKQLNEEKRTIIAADVIYDPDLVQPLINAISVLIGRKDDDVQAIISATIRNCQTFNLFLDTCEQCRLRVDIIDLPRMDEENPTFWDSALDRGTEVKIMRITRR